MNLSSFTAQLFVEIKDWVEGLLLEERANVEKKLTSAKTTFEEFVQYQEAKEKTVWELIDGLKSSQEALNSQQVLCADSIKSLETVDHEALQKWADGLKDPVAKAQQQFSNLAERITGIESEFETRMDEFETTLISHLVEYEEKFVTDYVDCLKAELDG